MNEVDVLFCMFILVTIAMVGTEVQRRIYVRLPITRNRNRLLWWCFALGITWVFYVLSVIEWWTVR